MYCKQEPDETLITIKSEWTRQLRVKLSQHVPREVLLFQPICYRSVSKRLTIHHFLFNFTITIYLVKIALFKTCSNLKLALAMICNEKRNSSLIVNSQASKTENFPLFP